MLRKNEALNIMLPGIATEIVACDICMRCSNNGGLQNEALVINDHDICLSDKCPVSKLRKIVGFRFNFGYTYFSDTENYEQIIPS